MSVIDYILDLLYPPRCMLCGRVLRYFEKSVCKPCTQKLPKLLNPDIRMDVKNVRFCIAPFQYRDEIRESLHRYKFKGAAAYGQGYAEFIAKSIDENKIFCDIISWVPLSKKRLRERGYDQAEIIASALAKKLDLPCVKTLEKSRDNRRQSSISDRQKRRSNVSGVYRCVTEKSLVGKKILLVDDIITSGSTVSECARQLINSGCSEVYAVAAAITSL